LARSTVQESVNDLETVRRHRDGTLVPVSIAAAPVRDGSGRVVGNMVAYTDITERKVQAAEVHRLNAELHVRLEELAASRARIVAAGDVERRRLERNLHDGAQQRLVALALSLRIALAKLDSEPEAARAALVGAGEELARALDELRELARGLHPALLTDRGLPAAVEMLAGRAPVPVEIAEVPDERLPEAVEAAAYYLIAEALTSRSTCLRPRSACGSRRAAGICWSRSPTTASAARTRRAAPACVGWPTASRRWAARSRWSARPALVRGYAPRSRSRRTSERSSPAAPATAAPPELRSLPSAEGNRSPRLSPCERQRRMTSPRYRLSVPVLGVNVGSDRR
jgi:PAS domain-containing protein